MDQMRGTTILGVKRNGKTVIAGDGQVTMQNSVIFKNDAKKVRRIYNDKVIIGFAGAVSDAFALSNRLEEMLEKYSGNLMRSVVEIAMGFRDDKYARQLEALVIVADKDQMLVLSGSGEVSEFSEGVCAIGSGGNFAFAAAEALIRNTDLSAREIALKSMEITADICVFTNHNFTIEEI